MNLSLVATRRIRRDRGLIGVPTDIEQFKVPRLGLLVHGSGPGTILKVDNQGDSITKTHSTLGCFGLLLEESKDLHQRVATPVTEFHSMLLIFQV